MSFPAAVRRSANHQPQWLRTSEQQRAVRLDAVPLHDKIKVGASNRDRRGLVNKNVQIQILLPTLQKV